MGYGGHAVTVGFLAADIEIEYWIDKWALLQEPRIWFGVAATVSGIRKLLAGFSQAGKPKHVLSTRHVSDKKPYWLKEPLTRDYFGPLVRESYGPDQFLGRYFSEELPLSSEDRRNIVQASVDLVAQFCECLKRASSGHLPGYAWEGMLIEVKGYRRGGDAKLRRSALERAQGRCEVCRYDFGDRLEGMGAAVLQVHHKQQRSTWEKPRLVRVSQLAVVCANCHRLIHADPRVAVPVGRLRRDLLADAGYPVVRGGV